MSRRIPFTTLLIVLILLSVPYASLSEERARVIDWENLLSSASTDFDDPFLKLNEEQMFQVRQVVRIRHLRDTGKSIDAKISSEEEPRITAELKSQGIDVDWLISQRERVARERARRTEQADEGLMGAHVRIPGYILPLAVNGEGKITEFLLVPWVGACIHSPTPPPNQIIHVSYPQGTEPRGHFSAIWLEGTITFKPADYHLFLVDGKREVRVVYDMEIQDFSDYSADESDVLAKVEIPEDAFKGHGWLQAWQAKISLIFTRAMAGLRAGGSSNAFWFAMLVAFGYGLVHTLGPGHGKAVVISYFVGAGGSFRKGVSMGVIIAVCHVFSSIIVVLLADFAVRQATGQAPSDYRMIRLGSYALVVVIGAVMLRNAIRSFRSREDGHSDHDHHHHDCLACAALEKRKDAGKWLALAVGSVPCTGALLVLLFGLANDLLMEAILMVAAISAGMAIAMSCIGILAIIGRRAVFRRMKGDNPNRDVRIASVFRIAGACLVLLIGCLLSGITISQIMIQ